MPELGPQGPPGDFLDGLKGRIPPLLNWCLGAAGAVTGWSYARQTHSLAPLVCIVWGALLGFFFCRLLFASFKVLKYAAVLAMLAIVLNYAILIPLGCEDQMPRWVFNIEMGVRRYVLPRLYPAASSRPFALIARRSGRMTSAPATARDPGGHGSLPGG